MKITHFGLFRDQLPWTQLGETGPAVFLLEGLSVRHGLPEGLARIGLANTFKTWAENRRIFHVGRPVGLAEGSTLSTMAALVADLIHEKAPEGGHLVGQGLGGALGLAVAGSAPGQVKSLSLWSSGPRLSPQGRRRYQHWLDLAAAQKWPQVHQEMAKLMFTSPLGQWLGGWIARGMAADLGLPGDEGWDFMVSLQAELAFDAQTVAGRLQMPVLSLHGDRDGLYDSGDLREFTEQLPQATLEIFPGQPYGLFKTRQDQVLDLTYQFIARHQA